MFAFVLSVVLVVACVLVALVALIAPGILPDSIITAFNLGTAVPTATPQRTRAAIEATISPTIAWRVHTSERVGVTIRLPEDWIVIDQAGARWRDEVRDLAEIYGWAETLFETGRDSRAPSMRATDPSSLDLHRAHLAVFTVGPAGELEPEVSFDDIGQIARDEPLSLLSMATALSSGDFSARRSEATLVNGREALLVEFNTRLDFLGNLVPVLVRMFFIRADDTLYLVSYLVDEQSAEQNQFLYDEIVQSFNPWPQ